MTTNSVNDKDAAIVKRVEAELNEKMMTKLKERKKNAEELEIFEVKENFCLSPVKKYLKYKRKKREYKKIYQESVFNYYFTIKLNLIWKFVKKNMLRQIATAACFSLGFYLFYNWGIKEKLINLMHPIWLRLKGLFSFFRRNKVPNVISKQ